MEEELVALKTQLEAKDIILAEMRKDAQTLRQRNDFLLGHAPANSRKTDIDGHAEWLAREDAKQQHLLNLEAQLSALGIEKQNL